MNCYINNLPAQIFPIIFSYSTHLEIERFSNTSKELLPCIIEQVKNSKFLELEEVYKAFFERFSFQLPFFERIECQRLKDVSFFIFFIRHIMLNQLVQKEMSSIVEIINQLPIQKKMKSIGFFEKFIDLLINYNFLSSVFFYENPLNPTMHEDICKNLIEEKALWKVLESVDCVNDPSAKVTLMISTAKEFKNLLNDESFKIGLNKAIFFAEEIENKSKKVHQLISIGNTFIQADYQDRGVALFQRAFENAIEIDFFEVFEIKAQLIFDLFVSHSEPEKALAVLDRFLERARNCQEVSDFTLSWVYDNYLLLNKKDKAMNLLKILEEEMDHPTDTAAALFLQSIAKKWIELGKDSKAIEILEKAKDVAKTVPNAALKKNLLKSIQAQIKKIQETKGS